MSVEWSGLLKELSSERLISCLKESKYTRLWDYYGRDSGMDRNEFLEFCYWARKQL